MARPTDTGSINLAKFEHIIKPMSTEKSGKIECIIIPIERNHLIRTDKGNVFFNFAAFEKDPAKRLGKETHTIKQSLSPEELENKGIDSKDLPFLGDMKDWSQNAFVDAPNKSEDLATDQPDEDDLPF